MGNFFCPTLIVAPLTSKWIKKKELPTHYALESVPEPVSYTHLDVYKRQIWDWCESELDLDVRFPAPQTEDTLDCALLEGEMASNVLAALREQDLPELADEIAPDWDLPTEAVQSGLETLRSHLELVRGDAALLYEMV